MARATSCWEKGGKRAFDLVVAASLALLLLPIAVLVALLVVVVDGPPVLFSQTRIGRGGVPFRMLKFRTMREGAGRPVTAATDPRITSLGRVLRRTKLDELPQLWNVVRGEMSLVGPRPEVPGLARTQPRGFRAISSLRPGLTDWASLVFHDEEQVLAEHLAEPEFYVRHVLPRKLALARLYRRRLSWRTDLAVLAVTAGLVLGARGPAMRLLGDGFVVRARSGL